MTAKTYKTKVVEPFIAKLKNAIRSIVTQYLKLKSSVNDLQRVLYRSQERVESLTDRLMEAKDVNKQLRETARDFGRVKNILGEKKTAQIIGQAKASETLKKTCSTHQGCAGAIDVQDMNRAPHLFQSNMLPFAHPSPGSELSSI
jgi:predicted RNase H-like nuclease (RuvC/YqgF family)